jgi:hypothetical protein
MLRRIACGTLLCAMAALAGACGSTTTTPTTPTTPTTTTTTETFQGLLNPAGTVVVSFVTQTGGAVTATLSAVGPDSTQPIGFSLGTYTPALNTCSVNFDNPAALQASVFNATATSTGFYCVRMYDNGSVTAAAAAGTAQAFTYTVVVTHP